MDETRNYRVSWSSGRLVEPTLGYSNHSNDVDFFNGRWVDNLTTEVTDNGKAIVESDQKKKSRRFIYSYVHFLVNL